MKIIGSYVFLLPMDVSEKFLHEISKARLEYRLAKMPPNELGQVGDILGEVNRRTSLRLFMAEGPHATDIFGIRRGL